MDETIYVIIKVQFNFALKVWFSIGKSCPSREFKTLLICILTLFCQNKNSRENFRNLQLEEETLIKQEYNRLNQQSRFCCCSARLLLNYEF